MLFSDPHRNSQFLHNAKRLLSHLPPTFEVHAKRFYFWLRRRQAQYKTSQSSSRPTFENDFAFPALKFAHCLPWDLGVPPGNEPCLPPVTVVVPIFNAFDHVRCCIDSVIAHTSKPATLLLIDDASTDNRMKELLDHYGKLGAKVYRNRTNLGYTASVNLGITMSGKDDVVLLNSDTQVSQRWLDGLRLAAYSAHDVGSATPLSDNAGAFSAPAPGPNEISEDLSFEEVARLTSRSFLGYYPEAPTGNGFCMYLKRAMINDIGMFDEKRFPRGYGEENDLCLRALDRGWRHVVDTRTYVHHARNASFGQEKENLLELGHAEVVSRYPEYPQLVEDFLCSLEMDSTRSVLEQSMRKVIKDNEKTRPRILFVISTTTGGTPQINQDLMSAVSHLYEAFLLVCDSEVVTLSRLKNGALEEVENTVLQKRVRFLSHRSRGYDQHVYQWLIKYSIELVHIRHVSWHGLELPRLAASLNIPVIFSFHDFYTLCPNVNLVDAGNQFCGGDCHGANNESCSALRWQGEMPTLFGESFVGRWRNKMTAMLAMCDAYVTTSESAKELIRDKLAINEFKSFKVIPHGRSFNEFLPPQIPETPVEQPYKMLIPGNTAVHKGAGLLSRIYELDTAKKFEFHFLGVRNHQTARIGIQHGSYKREDFQSKVAKIRPYVGLVFSIWPETYCHTLTELWASGIPVIAIDLGAVGERIRKHGGGWLLSSCDPDKVFAQMQNILADHEGYLQRCEDIRVWQSGYGRQNTTENMAASYLELYSKVLEERLAIRPIEKTI